MSNVDIERGKRLKDECVEWIREWFEQNGKDCCAVIGISGGKDSTVAAALCVEALGKDRVFGVLLPNGYQSDINDALEVCNFLKIKHTKVTIQNCVAEMKLAVLEANRNAQENEYATIPPAEWGSVAEINLPPRIRMSMLYYISQCLNGRVVNTCNLSEDYVGYSTRWGDSVGDFSPLANFTSEEVVAIGDLLGLPYNLTHKTPSDGLCGKTDEDNLGFTYDILNKYIRTGICEDKDIKNKIDDLHNINSFKRKPIPTFVPPILT